MTRETGRGLGWRTIEPPVVQERLKSAIQLDEKK